MKNTSIPITILACFMMSCASGPDSKHPNTIEKRDYRIQELVEFYNKRWKPEYGDGKWKNKNRSYAIGLLEGQITAIDRLKREKSIAREVLVDDLSEVNIKTVDFEMSLQQYRDKLVAQIQEMQGTSVAMCLEKDFKITEKLSGGQWNRTGFHLFAKERKTQCSNYSTAPGFQNAKGLGSLNPYYAELLRGCSGNIYTRGWVDQSEYELNTRSIIIHCQQRLAN